MTIKYSSHASKQLILQYVLENIEFKKRSRYLQEIVSMSKENDILGKMLIGFFRHNVKRPPLQSFCKN